VGVGVKSKKTASQKRDSRHIQYGGIYRDTHRGQKMPLYKQALKDGTYTNIMGAPSDSEGELFDMLQNKRQKMATAIAEEKGLLDEKAMFPDRLLLQTHPSEMSSAMLDAAQARINEDPEFAMAYRNSTDYVPNPLKAMKRLGERALSATGSARSFGF
jgi:hypothetical protein